MRPDRIRLGVLAVVTVFAFPWSTVAQTTTITDAAIAELRQLLAEQRTALDRQARIIEEQGNDWRRCRCGSKAGRRRRWQPRPGRRRPYQSSRQAARLQSPRRICFGGQDAVYDPLQASLRALPVASVYFGYEHAWSRVFTTAVTYGVVNVSKLDIQLEDAFHRTQRTSINLMWNPVPFVDIIVEYLAGTRVNKDGQRASSSQIQSGWTLKF